MTPTNKEIVLSNYPDAYAADSTIGGWSIFLPIADKKSLFHFRTATNWKMYRDEEESWEAVAKWIQKNVMTALQD